MNPFEDLIRGIGMQHPEIVEPLLESSFNLVMGSRQAYFQKG